MSARNCIRYILDSYHSSEEDNIINFKTYPEEITCLHISCAIGDYMSIELLLKRGASQDMRDQNKRVPMHYAALANVQSVLTLCSNKMDFVNEEDANEKTPFILAQNHKVQASIRFLQGIANCNVPKLVSTSRSSKIDDLKNKLMSVNLNRWIPLNIKSYACPFPHETYLLSRVDNVPTCQCWDPIDVHESLSSNPQFDQMIQQRFANADQTDYPFFEKPTDCFGQLESLNGQIGAQYCRLSDNTNPSLVSHLVSKIWKMSRPQLIISMYGSKLFDTHHVAILNNGLWNTAKNTSKTCS
ncbi:hypothetical protein Ciccas_008249 [Cichlidogyrus casuarinus]|uniref:TRPM SLOG domain-containing protein n=1 Tax=Cichlidogyrus casuarinus TaxID=1844966 RepID=A0ABD2Q0I1_9PLAT